MNCELDMCVYHENGRCLLDEISIDIMGMCSDAVFVMLPENELAGLKTIHREKISKRWDEDAAEVKRLLAERGWRKSER